MRKNRLLAITTVGTILFTAACSSGVASPGSPSTTGTQPSTSSGAVAAASSPVASPAPTPGHSLMLDITSSDGYQATVKLTVAPHVEYVGTNPTSPSSACGFSPQVGQGKYVSVAVTGELTAKAVNGFTWPANQTLRIFVKDGSRADNHGSLCYDTSQLDGLYLTPGTPRTVFMLYEAKVTPNNPNGWDGTFPWSSVELEVDTNSSPNYTCSVVSKDAGYQMVGTKDGSDWVVGAA